MPSSNRVAEEARRQRQEITKRDVAWQRGKVISGVTGTIRRKVDRPSKLKLRHQMPERGELRYAEAGQGMGPRQSNVVNRSRRRSPRTLVTHRSADDYSFADDCDVSSEDSLGVNESGESEAEDVAVEVRREFIAPRRSVARSITLRALSRGLIMISLAHVEHRFDPGGKLKRR